MLRRRLVAPLAGVLVAAALAACSGGSDTKDMTPEAALTAARDALAAAKFVHFELTSADVPAGQNGVTAGTGTGEVSATEPKFEGTVTGTVNGLTGNIPIVCVGDKAWWKLFTPDYTVADLASVNAPNPCALFHPTTGIGSLVDATADPKAGKRVRLGKDVVTQYTGSLPGKPLSDLLHLGDGTGTYAVTYAVSDDGQLRQASMTGGFYTGATSTFTLTLTDYGKTVTITPPM